MGNPIGYRIERFVGLPNKFGDLDAINELLKQLSKEKDPPKLTQGALDSLVANKYQTYIYVSRVDNKSSIEYGKIIGIGMLTTYRKMSGGGRIVGYIDDVVVHSDHKRRGNCSALMLTLLDQALMFDVHNIDLTTSRPEALLAYEKIGFKVRKTSPMRYVFNK